MDAYDSDLHEPQQRLEAIDARLAQHEQATRLALIEFLLLAGLALALLVNIIPDRVPRRGVRAPTLG